MLAVPGVYLLYQRQKISDFSEAEPVHRRSFDWMAAAGVCGNRYEGECAMKLENSIAGDDGLKLKFEIEDDIIVF